MDNVIVIILDSVNSNCLGNKRTKVSSTPFLDKMIAEGFFAPNIFSYGPYTDAAIKGLLTGTPTLNDYGYYFGINSVPYNPYRIFKEAGYETYGFYYPYCLFSSQIEQFIDHPVYTSGFNFESCWFGKFEYYAEILKKRELSIIEYKLVGKVLSLIFECWINFYTNLISKIESSILIDQTYDKNLLRDTKSKLIIENEKFNSNHIFYINQLLKKGMNHTLASIDIVDVNKFIDKKLLIEIYKENKKYFSKIHSINMKCNKKNTKLKSTEVLTSFKEFFQTFQFKNLRYIINYFLCLFSVKIQHFHSLRNKWQYMASAKHQFGIGLKLLKVRENKNKPFYMAFHLEEAHERISNFSYDIFDKETINGELYDALPLIASCDKDFSGNLVYQLSLNYIDSCLKEFVSSLDEMGELENTTIMIVADHGSSYTYVPIRPVPVNSFYKENYNIPFLIWSKDTIKKPSINIDWYSANAVFPTLFSHVGIDFPSQFSGPNIMKDKGKGFVITEYMGPGCPDMLSREVWISIRDNKYMIAYKMNIASTFIQENIFQLFDLKKDPYELENLSEKIVFNSHIKELVKNLENRFNEIQKSTNSFLSKI